MDRISLDPASILDEAAEIAGCNDFGDASFHAPLERLCDALDGEANLNAAGRAAQRDRILNILVTRARTEAFLADHDEILDEEIVAPVVILGLPRSGTTMLHRVIAEDPGFDSAKWYECRFPAPPTDWDWVSPDPRRAASIQREAERMAESFAKVAKRLAGSGDLREILGRLELIIELEREVMDETERGIE